MPRDCLKNLLAAIYPHNTVEQNNSSDPLADWEGTFCFDSWDTCVCGQIHIKCLNKIINKKNNNMVFPIGSTCIKRFIPGTYNKIQSEKDIFDKTCSNCQCKKKKKYKFCDKCMMTKEGEWIRQKFIPYNKMDIYLLKWLLRKHWEYKKGTKRDFVLQCLKTTRSIKSIIKKS